jgi:tetratricopeptide (TPR) repeat protein
MKFKFIVIVFILVVGVAMQATAQKKATTKQKPPTNADMAKMMADAMKGMSADEKTEMKKMMKDIMSAMNTQSGGMAYYPDFNANKELVPKKDAATNIASLSKKKLAQQDMGAYSGNLYNKIMIKGNADEIALVKSVLSKISKANDFAGAAILAMMQGHPQAAMALSMKAVQLAPTNVNAQNNMAALLTQYGYPEQAMPVLEKLKAEFPYNSTVLNNIGQAWFSLGDLDSAKKYFSSAVSINPHHPDATLCGGIIDELKGDPKKAEKAYIDAMENSANPLTDKILKNKAGDKAFEKIDFEKIKRSITIYEYFPKDWIAVPALSDNVSGYENDVKIQNGYEKMFTELQDKIDTAQEAAGAEADALMNKGQEAFVKQMAAASMRGINKMSLTAVTVQKILQIYIAQWMQDNMKEYMDLTNTINTKYTEMTKSGDNDKCPDFDRKNNEFLAYANPLIRKFHTEKIETFRNWLNAFCTWVWYITGNPKNTVMTMCIGWTGALVELYKSAIHEQRAIAKSCVEQNSDGSHFVPTPEIPNFACPTLVKVPIGKDWQDLNNSVNNFDANSLGIKNNPANAVPNHTEALGGGHASIAQPGIAPFVQSDHGSVAPGMINDTDDEQVPLSKIPLDKLTPLSKIPLDELTPLPDLRRSKLLRKLLKKMMTADCKNVNKYKYKPPVFEVRVGELIIEEPSKNITETKEDGNVVYVTYDDGSVTVFMEDGSILEIEAPSKNVTATSEDGDITYVTYDDGSEAVFMEDGSVLEVDAPKNSSKTVTKKITIKPKTTTPDIVSKNKVYTDLKEFKTQLDTNNLQPSLNSGVQVPGTFTPQKGLFQ